jgi:hypothetical protein
LGPYLKDTARLEQALAEALKTAIPSFRNCPRCGDGLLGAKLGKDAVEVDSCSKCFGLWLDKGDFAALKTSLGLA